MLNLPVGEAILRTALAFVIMIGITRLAGRKQIGQLSFFDYVSGITVGSIAATMAIDNFLPIALGIASLITWSVLVMVLNWLNLKNVAARKITDAHPIMAIYRGKILDQNLGSRYYNVNDILMQLREKGIFDPGEVELGFMEADGKLSVLKKSELADQPNPAFSGRELILNGRILAKNLADTGLTPEWLQQQLQQSGVSDASQVLVAFVKPDGQMYIDQTKDQGIPQLERH